MTGIPGFATAEGTQRFAQRAASLNKIPSQHFHTTADGLTLSSLGMGSYLGEPNQSDSELMESAVRRSISSGGINVIDTAINYRYQASEVDIGRAIASLVHSGDIQRDEIFVGTKNGFLSPDFRVKGAVPDYMKQTYVDTGIVDPKDVAGGMHCMSPSFLADQIDRSRNNLGLETLDLLYLHNTAESQLPVVGFDTFLSRLEAAFAYLETARNEGKLRSYGLATWDCFRTDPHRSNTYLSLEEMVAIAHKVAGPDHGFRYVQLPYNYAFMEAFSLQNQTVSDELCTTLEAAIDLDIGVFVSVPLLQGQLLDQVPSMRLFRKTLDTPALSCLQFVRSTPGVVAPLVGHKQTDHVEENLRLAYETPLNDAEFASFMSHQLEIV